MLLLVCFLLVAAIIRVGTCLALSQSHQFRWLVTCSMDGSTLFYHFLGTNNRRGNCCLKSGPTSSSTCCYCAVSYRINDVCIISSWWVGFVIRVNNICPSISSVGEVTVDNTSFVDDCQFRYYLLLSTLDFLLRWVRGSLDYLNN
jgi:hypothetical protein